FFVPVPLSDKQVIGGWSQVALAKGGHRPENCATHCGVCMACSTTSTARLSDGWSQGMQPARRWPHHGRLSTGQEPRLVPQVSEGYQHVCLGTNNFTDQH